MKVADELRKLSNSATVTGEWILHTSVTPAPMTNAIAAAIHTLVFDIRPSIPLNME
jgi:hypothetical protein